MTDKEKLLQKPDGSDDELPETLPKLTRAKRPMSEKQLANLAKAREKAKVSLNEKRARNKKLKEQEKKLKELKLKEKEDRIEAEMKALQKTAPAPVPAPAPAPPQKKKKKKIVYVDDSSSDEEVVYVKRPKAKRVVPPKQPRPQNPVNYPMPAPTPAHLIAQDMKKAEDDAVKERYNNEVRRLRRQYMMQQVFPGS